MQDIIMLLADLLHACHNGQLKTRFKKIMKSTQLYSNFGHLKFLHIKSTRAQIHQVSTLLQIKGKNDFLSETGQFRIFTESILDLLNICFHFFFF
jgi:hypothetical protein